jgi:hypothetical protein
LPQGQILDEFRALGEDRQTVYLTTTIRAYNAAADRWELVGMEEGNGLQDVGTGRRVGDEVHIEQRFGVAGPHPIARRIRYHNIRPDSFSWASDRSPDGGKTWVKDDLLIEAKRIGPSRSQEPLTRVKGASGKQRRAPACRESLLMPPQLFARDASNLCKSSDAGGELDLREKAKHGVRYAVEEASAARPVVPAGRIENYSKVFS